jgi:hypothetical protein
MTKHSRITTAALRKRETAARRTQDAVGPSSEIPRLQAQVEELLTTIRQRELVIAGLRRELQEVVDESFALQEMLPFVGD